MADLEVVGISLDARKAVAEAAALRRGLHKVDTQSERTARKTAKLGTAFDRTASRIKGLALAYVGLAAATRAIGAGAAAIREHEQLAARLNTLAGSAKAGAAAMQELVRFAAETPFALEASIEAFARFRSVGLTPSIEEMRRLGDFAAAMGKNINDAAAASVQAAFGESERLKSFSVATQLSATEIKLAYDDVTRTIQRTGDAKTDAAAILAFITDLSKSRFGNAMAEQMKTVAGATSNLKDSLGLLAVEIGEGGFRKAWTQSTAGAAKLTSELTEQLRLARETAAAERRTLEIRSKAFQASRGAIARGNELERNLLRHFRASPEQEAAALDVILGRTPEAPPETSPLPGGPTGPPADRQFRLDELRATILEMTHGRETADQFRVSVAGTSAALVDQELALARARDSLVEHDRTTEVAAQAEKTRQARIDAAIQSQERYVVLLTKGRQAASRLDFVALSPDAAQLDAWDALAKRIEAASTATDTFTASGEKMRDAMRDAERRAWALEGAVSTLLRTVTSGENIIGALASVLQGHLINAVAGRVAGAIVPATPIPAASPVTPTPTTGPVTATGDRSGGKPGTVVHFNQKIEVNAIDQRGVSDFIQENYGAIGGAAVQAIRESSALRLGVVGR